MTAHVADSVIDNGLASLKSAADRIYIVNSNEPTDFAGASGANMLGSIVLTAGAIIPGAIAAGTNGRKVSTVAIGSGVISATGSAYYWAICDSANLLAVGSLASAQVVSSGNSFSLASFDITIKSQ